MKFEVATIGQLKFTKPQIITTILSKYLVSCQSIVEFKIYEFFNLSIIHPETFIFFDLQKVV